MAAARGFRGDARTDHPGGAKQCDVQGTLRHVDSPERKSN
jgi:hypothetical protein